jgi:protein-S-isoprenylcysteine O-methyltransferase Ste14
MQEPIHATASRTELARRAALALWSLLFLAFAYRLAELVWQGTTAGELWTLELVRILLITVSLGLIVYAYSIRTAPRVPAEGWAERWFPLAVAILGFGFFLFRTPPPPVPIYAIGSALCIAGWAVTLWAFAHLRGSFSIFAEVRELVRSGPYSFVRHPLYAGEILNWIGLGILYAGWPVALYTAGLVALQVARARVEERKLRAALGPVYEEYSAGTGFLWPRPWR